MKRARIRTPHAEHSTQNRRARTARHQAARTGARQISTSWRAAMIVVAASIVYANSLSAPFIFDDQYSVVENPAIRSLAAAGSQPHNTPLAGRPVAGFTFALNYAASDLDPSAYRLTNVVIHVGCALLLFGIVRRTLALPPLSSRFGNAAPDLATAAALLWAVHPLTTDAVTYITQRTESLTALLYLLTLYASLRAYTSPHASRWYALAVIACTAGAGSKESMATAPLTVLLFDRVFLFDSFRDAFHRRWRLYAGLALTWVLLGVQLASAPRANSAGFTTDIGVWTYLLNQTTMILRYLRLVVWPVDLVINYGPPSAVALRDVLPQAIGIVAMMLLTAGAFRWKPEAAFLGAWFFITLAPSSSFVPIATEVGAERRMYLPLMAVLTGGTVALYVWAADRTSRAVAAAIVAAVALAFGAGTIKRNREHQSWLTLAQTTLERWPTDAAYAGVGGELARLRRDDEALPFLRIAARTDARARYNLGITLFNLNRYDEAVRELDVLVSKHPMREEVPWSRKVMGHAYMRMTKWPDSIAQLRMALAMTPHDGEARRLLVDAYTSHGVHLAQAGRFGEAIDEFRQALSLDDSNASARYNLATALFDNQQLEESFVEAERALALNPSNADAHHLVGKLLALKGRMNEAVQSLETAIKLRPGDHVIRDDLGRVLRALP